MYGERGAGRRKKGPAGLDETKTACAHLQQPRGRLHEEPRRGGRAALQEAVQPLYKERRHRRRHGGHVQGGKNGMIGDTNDDQTLPDQSWRSKCDVISLNLTMCSSFPLLYEM